MVEDEQECIFMTAMCLLGCTKARIAATWALDLSCPPPKKRKGGEWEGDREGGGGGRCHVLCSVPCSVVVISHQSPVSHRSSSSSSSVCKWNKPSYSNPGLVTSWRTRRTRRPGRAGPVGRKIQIRVLRRRFINSHLNQTQASIYDIISMFLASDPSHLLTLTVSDVYGWYLSGIGLFSVAERYVHNSIVVLSVLSSSSLPPTLLLTYRLFLLSTRLFMLLWPSPTSRNNDLVILDQE